jgi:transcriptional regulator with XRE-family HTH domain
MIKIASPLQIGKNIKNARSAKGLSQQEIADLLEESRSTYAEWEKGTLPRVDIFFRIAEKLDTSPFSLLAVDENSFREADPMEHRKQENGVKKKDQKSADHLIEWLKDKERIIEEKEARLRELQEHKQDWKEQNKELMSLMKAQLNTLAGSVSLAHKEILTEIKALMRWEARRLAAGDKKKEKEILAELGTIVGAVHNEFWPEGSAEAVNR